MQESHGEISEATCGESETAGLRVSERERERLGLQKGEEQ
jgi:hypothetical protein